MNKSKKDNKELFTLKKNGFIIIGVLILIQFWFLWDVREKLVIDYCFLSEKTSNVKSTVYLVTTLNVEHESESGQLYSNNVYEYNYKFRIKGVNYKGKDVTVFESKTQEDTPFFINVEYLNSNPNINRVKEFAYIKDWFEFFKEYFMFKLIILLLAVIYIVFDFKEKKKKFLHKKE